MLEEKGFEVCELIVYENTSPDLKPLELDRPAVAVFASPSAVENFFNTNPDLKESIFCVAIGPVTAQYLEDRGISRVDVASSPDLESLLETIKEAIERGEGI